MNSRRNATILNYNHAGHGKAESEYELYNLLKKHIYSTYKSVKERFEFDRGCKPDYLAKEHLTNKPVLIEVKNWFVSIKDMEQILKYYVHALELYGKDKFSLIVYAGGIDPLRLMVLEKLGIEFYLTSDIIDHHNNY